MSRDEVSIHVLRKMVLDGFLIAGLLLCLLAVNLLWTPFERGFFCGDETLMYPYKDDTVTVLMLRVVGLGLPFIAFLICEWSVLRKERNDQRLFGVRIPAWVRGLYCVCASFGLGACFSELATDVSKSIIGRNRPHFFDICKPSINCSLPEFQHRYINYQDYTCTGDQVDKFVNMRKSFLSGHSSWAAYTMIYLALYLERRMILRGCRRLRHTIQFAVLMLTWFTALTRISDFKHHWSDVLAGYTLGLVLAVIMSFGTVLVKKKVDHAALPQFEVNSPQTIS